MQAERNGMDMSQHLINEILAANDFTDEQIMQILYCEDEAVMQALRKRATQVLLRHYGSAVYIRGLIEFSNYCRQDCYYCGIRASNRAVSRFRLTPEEILETAMKGDALGFKTLVLQGGEDSWFTRERFVNIIRTIKQSLPESRLTISIGVRSREDLIAFKEAGADRFLLRHETANPEFFGRLHPPGQSFAERQKQLFTLQELGYTTGAGFLIGAPGGRLTDHLQDIRFLRELRPQMIGIGPFIPQHDTPFGNQPAGSVKVTLKLLSILRVIFPQALLPATTALNTLDPQGRILGLRHGANVVMPNLSPEFARARYTLYDKKATGQLEAAEHVKQLAGQVATFGRFVEIGVGDPVTAQK
ncbi:MAG: [FeFe] hydrogenase H-cluster radical SAM maturase HydE [Lachnospiraceae bacterium]|nr:[FeFe] hydrogenase H-cluster radical SAM maturase HydE [Lachnospiraceae bacterium]